jgi:uncharacterized protein DUF6886
MPLYHFSEQPDIAVFEPRIAPSSALREPLVWAIDDRRQVMYFFPRDCPRACFWPGQATTEGDRERFFGAVDARMIIAVEAVWLDRIRAMTLYRYTMPDASFAPAADDSSGHWISRQTVKPLAVEPVHDLLGAIVREGVELRITGSLIELWKAVIQSSLEFSGTRLRNASRWSTVDWDAVPLGRAARRAPR